MLGATPVTTFLSVTLPLSLPGVFAAAIFGFVGCFGESAVPVIMGGVGYQLMGNTITSTMDVLNYPLAAAMSSIVVLAMLAPARWAGISPSTCAASSARSCNGGRSEGMRASASPVARYWSGSMSASSLLFIYLPLLPPLLFLARDRARRAPRHSPSPGTPRCGATRCSTSAILTSLEVGRDRRG